MMLTWTVRNDTILIVDNRNQILEYTNKGKYIRTSKAPIPSINAIAATNYGYIIHRPKYVSDNYSNNYIVHMLDKDFNITHNLIADSDNNISTCFTQQFSETNNSIFSINSRPNQYMYLINPNVNMMSTVLISEEEIITEILQLD